MIIDIILWSAFDLTVFIDYATNNSNEVSPTTKNYHSRLFQLSLFDFGVFLHIYVHSLVNCEAVSIFVFKL